MPPPSCTSTFQWMETNIMQMVKLKVSDTLLGSLSALALKHTGDAEIGIRTAEFWSNHELGFYFSIWMDKCKRKVYNTVRILFRSVAKSFFVFVICWCIMFRARWAPDYHKLWGVWSEARRPRVIWCLYVKDEKALCHTDTPVCMCIIMSAHPLQSRVLRAFQQCGDFLAASPLKKIL